MTNLKQINTYHKKKGKIKNKILSKTGKGEVVFGATAINKQVPKYLKSPTRDVDILTKYPNKEAKQVEKALDKMMGFNAFKTVKAKHPGTWKVKSNVTGKTRADYSKPKLKVPTKRIQNVHYVTLEQIRKEIINRIKMKRDVFRLPKDRDALNRINIVLGRKR